jgi:hypothetical protein
MAFRKGFKRAVIAALLFIYMSDRRLDELGFVGLWKFCWRSV